MPSKKYFTSDKRQDGIESNLNQVIDVIQEDISGSATRRKYQTFVTGGIGPGVTSSLYQTIYDQDFTLQTANAVMDMTVGLFHDNANNGGDVRSNLVTTGTGYNKSGNDQLLFDTSHTMMMREKVNIYRQYAKLLLGDANAPFAINTNQNSNTVDNGATSVWKTDTTIMDACLFINVKRLFARDRIRPETFAMRLYEKAPDWYDPTSVNLALQDLDGDGVAEWVWDYNPADGSDEIDPNTNVQFVPSDWDANNTATDATTNLFGTDIDSSEKGVKIIADIGALQGMQSGTVSGAWAYLKHAANANEHVGIIFYDAGIVVLNLGGSSAANSQWSAGNSPEAAKYETNADGGEGQATGIKPVFDPRDRVTGVISGMLSAHGGSVATAQSDLGITDALTAGQIYMGHAYNYALAGGANAADSQSGSGGGDGPAINLSARFYPDLLVSASIDDIVDHIGYTRFSSGSLTAAAFQNVTKINSSIFFCRATASQFNGSSNETWQDPDNAGSWVLANSSNDAPYAYITTVLLYDDENEVVAVAKLNRPIEKNNQSELTIRVRLDF